MGFLTPILIRNDAVHLFKDKKMQKQICEKLFYATCEREAGHISLHHPKGGIDINPIETLGTRHADVQRVIVISGNGWVDLSEEVYGLSRTVQMSESNLNYLKGCLRIAQRDITQLKKVIKASEEKRNA